MLVPSVFLMLFIAALVGLVRPYTGLKWWHFALGALASLIALGATVPPPTPAELAAREVRKKREAALDAAKAAREAREDAEANKSDHEKIADKARGAVDSLTPYKRSEYPQLYRRIGASTFAKLGTLEPGAVYAVAESRNCDGVSAMTVSDRSKPGRALWSADCANGNRFMISQRQAELALERYGRKQLAFSDLEESCTMTTVARCRLSVAQRAASKNEILFISNCDMLLEQALVSPSSMKAGKWTTAYGDEDTVIYRRTFDSQNSFGAMIRSHYRCDVDGLTGNITRFDIAGPMGTKRVL